MKEFNIPPYPPPTFPQETYIDEQGRIVFGCWTLLGFIEQIHELPEGWDKMMGDGNWQFPMKGMPMRGLPKTKNMETYDSAIN